MSFNFTMPKLTSMSSQTRIASRNSPLFEDVQPLLLKMISNFRVDDDGIISESGGNNLEQLFYEPPSLKQLQLPSDERDSSLAEYVIENVSQQATYSELQSTLRKSWEKVANISTISYDSRVLQCIYSNEVVNAVNFRLQGLRIHLLWQATFTVLENEAEMYNIPIWQIRRVFRAYHTTAAMGNSTLLEDLLMDTTSYGRMLKECKFETASLLAHNPEMMENPAMLDLKSKSLSLLQPIIHSIHAASNLRSQIVGKIGEVTADDVAVRNISNDAPLLSLLTSAVESGDKSYKREALSSPTFRDVFSNRQVFKIWQNLELDVLIDVSLEFTSIMMEEMGKLAQQQQPAVTWSDVLGKFSSLLHGRQYSTLRNTKARVGELGISQFPFQDLVQVGAVELTYHSTLLLACYICLKEGIITDHGYSSTASHKHSLNRLLFHEVRSYARTLLARQDIGANIETAIQQISQYGIPTHQRQRIEEVGLNSIAEFYTEIIRVIEMHYIDRYPELSSLAKLLESNESEYTGIRDAIVTAIIGHLHNLIPSRSEAEFLGKLDLMYTNQTLLLHLEHRYMHNTLISISGSYVAEEEGGSG